MTSGPCTEDPDFGSFLERGVVDGGCFVRPKWVWTLSTLKSSYCAYLRPLALPSLGLHLLMRVSGSSDMTRIWKRSACAGSLRGESSAATVGECHRMVFGRVLEAHHASERDAVPTQMSAPGGASRTLQLTRMSAEHVEADQSADKRTYVVLVHQQVWFRGFPQRCL